MLSVFAFLQYSHVPAGQLGVPVSTVNAIVVGMYVDCTSVTFAFVSSYAHEGPVAINGNQRHRPYVAHDGLLIIRGAHGKAGVNATSHNAGRLWVPAGIDVEAAVVHFDFRHLRRVRRRERTRRELKQIDRYFAEPAVSGMFAALHLGQRRRTSHLRI